MHAVRLHEYSPTENLRYEEVPDLTPSEGQVRIAAEASGVHLIDMVLRGGTVAGILLVSDLPMTPGREVAGTVDKIGPGVDGQWSGRRVLAHLGAASGGYAEQAVAAVASLHEIPDQQTAEVAVAMIGTGRTAVGVLEVAGLTDKDVVLVTAAAGGLGSLFLQAARNAGATAIGVAGGAEKTAIVRSLGADVAVDYLQPDWAEQVRGALDGRDVSVVLDGVGGALGRAALELLGVGGRIVIFGWSAGEPLQVTTQDLNQRGLTATEAAILDPRRLREMETRALAEAAAGRLVPLVQRFRLSDAPTAHTALESRGTAGKVVLEP